MISFFFSFTKKSARRNKQTPHKQFKNSSFSENGKEYFLNSLRFLLFLFLRSHWEKDYVKKKRKNLMCGCRAFACLSFLKKGKPKTFK